MTATADRALVLFSGGQDSATCLAWALARYSHVETIGFAYGQRHAVELACRAPLRDGMAAIADWGARLGPDHVIDLVATIAGLGETALTSDAEIALGADGLPTTFVPGRNLLFLACAGALAYRRDLRRIVAGMCETDYSGYPDCRDDTIKAMQLALTLGLARRFVLETPLMWRDKAATWALAHALGGAALTGLIEEHSHSCYRGERTTRHPWGYGCGACPACDLRRAGWERWRAE
ncbi:MAG: 7-cyano-7-deazaguanine synthase QueC [Rhodospirillales bacterium]|nr:7-cyano-7-deazaguanine synthase QueC [Rhodospirillales bacterium]